MALQEILGGKKEKKSILFLQAFLSAGDNLCGDQRAAENIGFK